MTSHKKLYVTAGTVCFRDKDQSAVLNNKGELVWVPKKVMTLVEGDVIWILYRKEGQTRIPESIIPYEQATLEDLRKDFDEEGITRPSENRQGSSDRSSEDRQTVDEGSGSPDEDLSGV